MNLNPQQPDRSPDLRLIVDERRILMVAWRPDLAGAKLHAGPIDQATPTASSGYRLGGIGRNRSVYEGWRTGNDLFCREIRTELSVDRSPRLRIWAAAKGLNLRLGKPLPEFGPAPVPIVLLYRVAARPPDFRFVFVPGDLPGRHAGATGLARRNAGGRLRIVPWGFTDLGLERIYEPWVGAVGDVIALDRDRAIAHFARVDDGVREGAEDALRAWAGVDDWELEIEPGTRPLVKPARRSQPTRSSPTGPYSGRAVCRDCGDTRSTGSTSHMAFGTRGYRRTRCRICGGRYTWSSELIESWA